MIDLLAPMVEGGVYGLFAANGLGKQVIAEETAQRIVQAGVTDDYGRHRQSGLLNTFDAYILCNRGLFKRRIYPAIDPLQSSSRLLAEGLVSPTHRSVAQQVRLLLERYYELRKRAEAHSDDSFTPEDRQIFKRSQRVEQFLTQPFVVAEPYTDIPGEYVSLDEMIRGFEALLSGQYDDVPEQHFWMVGTIEQALTKG